MDARRDLMEYAELAEWAVNVARRETAYQYVYRVLRHVVLDGTFSEGTHLLQTDIARSLHVSTTPVREALHKLASEGLVDFDAGRGAVVHTLSEDEWRETIQIRRLLEPCALRRAADRIASQSLVEMERISAVMDVETDVVAWTDLNRQFHRIHFEAAGSPRLAGILVGLLDASAMFLARGIAENPDIARQTQTAHAAIIEGLRQRDG